MPLVLILVFIVLPIAELYVIIQVGGLIGVLPTLALLLVDGFLGAALARSQGRTAWRRFNEAIAAGRVPAAEVFDGAAIILGGALLLSPGFITDVFGIFLLLPPTRRLLRRVVVRTARKVGPTRPVFFLYDRGTARQRSADPRRPGRPPGGPGGGSRPARTYDFEGTANEVPDEQAELDDGRES